MAKARPRRIHFAVSFVLPPNCTVAHAKHVLEDHLSCMGGDLRPPGGDPEIPEGDPMFELDRDSIRVKSVR